MHIPTLQISKDKLIALGLRFSDTIHYQLSPEELVQQTLQRGEGVLNDTGALVINTGEFTGRSPKDKFIVKDEITSNVVDWNDFNQPIEEKYFTVILDKITSYLNSLPEIWLRDCVACADSRYRLNLRVITSLKHPS